MLKILSPHFRVDERIVTQKRTTAIIDPMNQTGGKAAFTSVFSGKKALPLEGRVGDVEWARMIRGRKLRDEEQETVKTKNNGEGHIFSLQNSFYMKASKGVSLDSQKKKVNPYINPKSCEPNPQKDFQSTSNLGVHCTQTHIPWIFYCGATDTMTIDSSDLCSNVFTNCTHIQTAN